MDKSMESSIDPEILYFALRDLEVRWGRDSPLSREEEEKLAETFTTFIRYSLEWLQNIQV